MWTLATMIADAVLVVYGLLEASVQSTAQAADTRAAEEKESRLLTPGPSQNVQNGE